MVVFLSAGSPSCALRHAEAAYDYGAAWAWMRAFSYAKLRLGYPYVRAKAYAVGRADLSYADAQAKAFSAFAADSFAYATDSLGYEKKQAEPYSLRYAQARSQGKTHREAQHIAQKNIQ